MPAKSLMIQGTCSDAGKSIITAAFCRILMQEGARVAPFKSQNMALNSYVTLDGREIARAQVVQAQAAGLEPDIRMSPILLKPSSDTKSQIVLNGLPVEGMTWQEYMKFKPKAFEVVKQSYDSLADEYDVVVIEGAGSPAEINLNHDDIVNMGMARYAKAPVLLVGDIDRGGVFASFVGTYELLCDWEKEHLAGYLINKFRGDPSLLKEALDVTQQRTGKPVFGTIPWIYDLGLPEEDSVRKKKEGIDCDLDIAIIGLNHLSNYTDFDAFDVEKDVSLSLVRNTSDLGTPDCIIIPGSKTTVNDLQFLMNSGMAQAIKDYAEKGGSIVGICGGFQMLGQKISDPHKLESEHEVFESLGLLNIETSMADHKTLSRTVTEFKGKAYSISGYEIHHGKTEVREGEVIIQSETDILGVRSGNVWGTYLHGIFDNDQFRREFLNDLRKVKNLGPIGKISTYDLEPAFDKLADVVRENVDLNSIYKLFNI
ncbi:MAG: cobyric acid synthase [Lentisphaeraceae bacterium]|nr:cobyric acid synthase [Lentisphaeraceae bacterium]